MTVTERGTEEDLERCIEDLIARKKSDIERSLAETIEQENEKARQRIVELEKEFQKGREEIGSFQSMLEEVRTSTEGVRERIGKHVEQAVHCRVMVRRMADKIGEECRNAEELGKEIVGLLRKADEETARVRSEFESRYGLSVPFGEMAALGGLGTDLEQALGRLSRYRDGLIALDEDERPVEEAPAFGPGIGGNGVDPEAVSRILTLHLKTETIPDVGAFRVYRNDGYAVLDAGSILEETNRFIGEARALHERLAEAKSAKEKYFFKRDILSRQDSLRKIVRRAVEICEQETCDLPLPTNDVLSVRTLMDIEERLNTGNWSDPCDLRSFEDEIATLRSALSPRLTDMESYGKAILEQLHETF
jgi:regulator of replication initiation timing